MGDLRRKIPNHQPDSVSRFRREGVCTPTGAEFGVRAHQCALGNRWGQRGRIVGNPLYLLTFTFICRHANLLVAKEGSPLAHIKKTIVAFDDRFL